METQGHTPRSVDRRTFPGRLGDPDRLAELGRLRREMFEQLAPAAEGPIVCPARRRRGRLVFGDACE
jgi:gluconate kinase